MTSTSTRQRTVLVAVAVVLATLVGGIALTGSAVAAENLRDGSTTHPSTGEYIYAANATEKKSITYGYVVENVTNTGESVELYLQFEDPFNNTAGPQRLSSFSGNVTCICGGVPESIGIASSASIVDGPDGDGNKETIKIGVQPNKRDTPIDLIVNFTGDVTWTDEHTNVAYNVSGAVDEPNEDVLPPERFENITVAGGLYTETHGSSAVTDSGATLSTHLWNLNGTSSTDLWFTYWEQGKKGSTQEWTPHITASTVPSTYDQSVTGLQDGTTYVFHSAANNGKEYDDGPRFTFTTEGFNVDTDPATKVRASNATVNGELVDLGGASSADVWFTYWEKGKKDTTQEWTPHQTKSSTGTFNEYISGLKSNTTYVVQAAGNDGNKHVTGTEIEFTTNGDLAVETDASSDVLATSATLNGRLTGLGDSSSSEVWFTYWEKGAKSSTQEWTPHQTKSSTGTFSESVSGLKNNTTYVVQAATNNGDSYDDGAQVEFTTNNDLTVETKTASSVGTNSATLNGDLSGMGDSTDSEVWFTYWEKGAKSSTQEWTPHQTKSSTGTFSESVSGLKSKTTYVYHAAANNSDTYDSGAEKEFTTN